MDDIVVVLVGCVCLGFVFGYVVMYVKQARLLSMYAEESKYFQDLCVRARILPFVECPDLDSDNPAVRELERLYNIPTRRVL